MGIGGSGLAVQFSLSCCLHVCFNLEMRLGPLGCIPLSACVSPRRGSEGEGKAPLSLPFGYWFGSQSSGPVGGTPVCSCLLHVCLSLGSWGALGHFPLSEGSVSPLRRGPHPGLGLSLPCTNTASKLLFPCFVSPPTCVPQRSPHCLLVNIQTGRQKTE